MVIFSIFCPKLSLNPGLENYFPREKRVKIENLDDSVSIDTNTSKVYMRFDCEIWEWRHPCSLQNRQMRAKIYGETCTNELFVRKLLSHFLHYFNKLAASTWMFWYQSNGNCLNFMFLYVVHVENNFLFQDSGMTLDKKIEKMTMCKTYLSLVMLANLVKAVPNNKVRTFIFKNMYSLL